ncbi:MAG: hypothetical protein ACPGRX_04805, partial [Bdellovibrionales bacterium]
MTVAKQFFRNYSRALNTDILMKMTRHINHLLFSSALALSLVVGTASFCVANAQSRAAKTPSLIITSGPLP